MGRPTFATWARHPATEAVVVALGVATASWALVHASESAARAAWTVPHLTAPDGSAIALAPMPPVLVGDSLRMSLSWTLTVLAWVAVPPNPLVSPVAWPGPTQPIDWSADRWALTLADPAALAPVVLARYHCSMIFMTSAGVASGCLRRISLMYASAAGRCFAMIAKRRFWKSPDSALPLTV